MVRPQVVVLKPPLIAYYCHREYSDLVDDRTHLFPALHEPYVFNLSLTYMDTINADPLIASKMCYV